MCVERAKIKVASWLYQLLRIIVLLFEEVPRSIQTILASSGVGFVVPESHEHASVSLVVVLPATCLCEVVEVRNPLQLIDRDFARRLVRIGAIACACGIIASTAWLREVAFDSVLVVVLAATPSRQAVPSRVGVENLALPLRCGKLVHVVAADKVAIPFEGIGALPWPRAPAEVEGDADAEVHAIVDQGLRRLGRDLEALNPRLPEAPVAFVVHNLIVQIPHRPCQVRHVLVLWRILLVVRHTVHVEGLLLRRARLQEALVCRMVPCNLRCGCSWRGRHRWCC